MARRAVVDPIWLDRMLLAWARADGHQALGYPSVCPMVAGHFRSGYYESDPTGYVGSDWRELESAILRLDVPLRDAILRAYKPWAAKTIEQHYPATSPVTWHRRLSAAAVSLVRQLTQHKNL